MRRLIDPVLTRLSQPASLSVRETYWGYTIETSRQVPRHYLMSKRAAGLALFYVFWLMLLGGWLGLIAQAVEPVMIPGLAVLWVAVAFAFWRLLLKQVGVGHIVQVDLSREMLRVGARCGDIKDEECRHISFADISEIVMERPRDPSMRPALKLRRRDGTPAILIAAGDEAALYSLHDRLSHDLTPIEQRVAAMRLPQKVGRPVFPPLGPSEITA